MAEGSDFLKRTERSLIKSITKSDYFKDLLDGIAIPELSEQLKKFSRSRKMSIGDLVSVMNDIKQINSTFKKFRSSKKTKPSNTPSQEVYGPEVPSDWDSQDAKRRQRQASSYENDVLHDFSKRLKDLTEKYGSESKAFDVMYKNNPLLKQIAKEMPGLTKAFMKSLPYLKIGGVTAAGAFTLWRTILKEQRGFAAEGIRGGRMGIDSFTAISANTALKASGGSEKSLSPIGKWKTNIGKMMMGGSSDFLVELAKYGVNLRGSGVGGFATGEEIFADVTKRIKQMRDSGDEERALALADIFGIDEATWKKIQQVEGGDVLKWIKQQGKDSGADRAAAEEDRTLRFHEKETKFLRGWKTNLLFPKRHKTVREAYLDSMSFGMHGALESVLPEKFRIIRNISNESSSLPLQGATSQESSSPQSGAQVSFNIGTIDVSADNPEQLAYELGAVASSHSKNHTLAVAFDSGLKA
jgi:hypothetical protein